MSGTSETSHTSADQEKKRQREAAPKIARRDRPDERASASELGGQFLHVDAAQVATEDLHAARVFSQKVEMVAARTGHAEPFGFPAVPERPHGVRPIGLVRDGEMHWCHSPGRRIQLQRLPLTLIELPHGPFERARQPIDFASRRVAEAAIEKRRGDPDRRRQGQDRRDDEGGDQAVAKSIHI